MKIGRSDVIYICKGEYKMGEEKPQGEVDYDKWVEFVEEKDEYFVWYEDTEHGKRVLEGMDRVPEWAKEGIIESLHKMNAYARRKISKNMLDLVLIYDKKNKIVEVRTDKIMKEDVIGLLIEMADSVGGVLVVNGSEVVLGE